MKYRIEKDTIGQVNVPADKYWGAQTERSRKNFKIGAAASMPLEIVYGFAYLKKAAAYTNAELGILTSEKRDLISQVCDEILAGKLDNQFPLVIWQTGSGTQSNMNVNEVIANRAHEIAGKVIGEGEKTIQPNDDVNKSQSSNDTFPTGMHIAIYKKIIETTIPGIEQLRNTLKTKSEAFKDSSKNRTYASNGCNSTNIRARIFGVCRTIKLRHKSIKKYTGTLITASTWWNCCWNRIEYPRWL
jgi:fumarate hydratase class II